MGLVRAQPACVKGFALDHLFLSGPDVGIELAAIEAELRRWCTEKKSRCLLPKRWAPPGSSSRIAAVG